MITSILTVLFFWFTVIASHVYVHAAVVMRVQGLSVDEIPEGGAFRCDGVVLVNHVLEGADLVGVAGLGLMQFCLCTIQRAQGVPRETGLCI